jgi:hypothetical protein
MAREKLKAGRRIGSGIVDARRARLWVSYAIVGIAAATAVICAYYLFVGFGYSTGSTSGNSLTESASLAWNARVAAAGASLQTTLWARRLIILGVLSFSTYPFARLRGRTLLERSGLISRDWKKAAASWAFVASCSLLALVALLNYYANATTWAIRSDFR